MTDPDYDDDADDRGPHFPAPVKVAGIIWIVFGILELFNLLANLALAAKLAAGGGNPGSNGGICGGIIGIAFLVVGVQTVRGTAKDVQGNSIGSIVFSLLFFAGAALLIGGGALLGQAPKGPAGQGAPPANQELQLIFLVMGLFVAFFGLLLLLAGILALSNRTAYLNWREANFPTERRRRRRREEDYEEDDDRDRDHDRRRRE